MTRAELKTFYRGAAMMFLSGPLVERTEDALAALLVRADENGQRRAEVPLDGPTPAEEPFRVDVTRRHRPETGIPIRAIVPDEGWDSVDIAHLDKASLDRWLRSRGSGELAIQVIMVMLGHPHKEVLELRHALVLLEDVARGLEKKNAGLREELKLERSPHSVLYERALARRVGRHPGGDA